jgi:hypothetical protein
MNILITERQYGLLSEMIKLDIKVGDTIMGGKFKNKKVVVKSIGKNDKGDITINGKPLLRFRILKENNFHLRRREPMMKEKIDSFLSIYGGEYTRLPLHVMISVVPAHIGTQMVEELNLTGDDMVILRNQIQQYIKNNFYSYLKDYWESKQ